MTAAHDPESEDPELAEEQRRELDRLACLAGEDVDVHDLIEHAKAEEAGGNGDRELDDC
ncbi:hypothetical protein ACFL59_11835 [Planctomycetota bacterium]